MAGFNKLFPELITSSIWSESKETRLVWITLLASKNHNGYVAASLPGLARMANVSLDECQMAVQVLDSPDPHSRSKENEGRRIEAVPGGWVVLNHKKYRDGVSDLPSDRYHRELMRKQREKENPTLPLAFPSSEDIIHKTDDSVISHDRHVTSCDGHNDTFGRSGSVIPDHASAAANVASWLSGLEKKYKEVGVDVREEYVKAAAWISERPGRRFTRRFLVNWLNKSDKSAAGMELDEHYEPSERH